MPSTEPKDVLSAGAVVRGSRKRVLLVHRPRYDDWSFPKGKLERAEHVTVAAVREVREETGLRVRLGVPLAAQRYPVAGGTKTVAYWVGRAVGDPEVSNYEANDEIDAVEWLGHDEARERLTYPYDRATLDEALAHPRRTQSLVVLRHGDARARRTWREDDRLRPLVREGRRQADRLAHLLAAYDVSRVTSSTSTRCVESVTPYLGTAGAELRQKDALSEEDATPKSVRRTVARLVDKLTEADRSGALCTHREVLPLVFDALDVTDPNLAKGELIVLHLRHGKVVTTERHAAR